MTRPQRNMYIKTVRSVLADFFSSSAKRTGLNFGATYSIPTTLRRHPNALKFSTSSTTLAKKGKGQAKSDKRITLIRYFLNHPAALTPRPLRFSRNRFLRHWTIHRAWNLYRSKLRQTRELELERQYNAMRDANEELRIAAGDGGRLFRRSQMKTGIWSIPERGGGVPIEYARGLVDYVGTKDMMGNEVLVWDHSWKR